MVKAQWGKHDLLVGDNRIDLMTGKITQGENDGSV